MTGRLVAHAVSSVLEWETLVPDQLLSWEDALLRARAAGDGWRVPEVDELLTLISYGRAYPATIVFPDCPRDWFWSATPQVGAGSAATFWAVSFSTGEVRPLDGTELIRVRLVRGGRP